MRTLTLVAALLLSTMAAGCNVQQGSDAKCVATLARYNMLRQGSTREDVKTVMLCEGELVASDRIGNLDLQTYRFLGRNGFMMVQFQGQAVVNIMQMGLQ